MSVSTHVVGFKPPDDTWKKMKAVWDSCEAAGIRIPKEVCEYFNDTTPDDSGVVITLEKHPCCKKYNNTNQAEEGIEITLSDLPKDVKIIRFYYSW